MSDAPFTPPTDTPATLHAVIARLRERLAELEAQVAGLEAMNTEKAAEIRRVRMGNHPAGRALRAVDEAAWRDLREALEERDAERLGYDPTRCPHDYAPCPFCTRENV